MEIRLTLVTARTARADVKGGVLHVRLPRHWPRSEKETALARFRRWASRRAQSLAALPPPTYRAPMSEGELWDLVRSLNDRTVRVPVAGVRIGRSRFSRLAQANWQTRILTFSRYALVALPDRALRYLILHELAHLRIPDHSPRFWDLVARFEPEWKHWRKVAQAQFVRAAEAASLVAPASSLVASRAAAQRPDVRPDPARDGESCQDDVPGNLAAAALFGELTGPHGIQLSIWDELAPEYPV